MYIFLDDEREPEDVTWVVLPEEDWCIARNYDEFVAFIEGAIENEVDIDFISFDHDLADEHYKVMQEEVRHSAFINDSKGGMTVTFDYGKEKTGLDCAKYFFSMVQEGKIGFCDYAVHSLNPVGNKRIEDFLQSAREFIENDGS